MIKPYLFIVSLICSIAAASQQNPFPSHTNYTVQHLTPQGYTQNDLDQICSIFYEQWKAAYLKQCGSGSYIEYQPNSNSTVSEAHGYGMMIFAYMAGYDATAQSSFDAMFQYYKSHPSYLNGNLMAWKQVNCVDESPGYTDAATDGDIDIAYALLLAHKQWGSEGTINYLSEAQIMMDAILTDEINPETYSVRLGDWAKQGNSYYYSTRSSDFITDHFKAFSHFSGNSDWDLVVNTCYNLIDAMQSQYSANTGLMPDFIVDVHQAPKPAQAHFLEGDYDGHYYYNSCRFPWRIGTDYLLNADGRAEFAIKKINTWLRTSTQGNVADISNGYFLNGTKIFNWNDPAFISGFTVAAMSDTNNPTWFNQLFSSLISRDFNQSGYYENSIKLLSLLVITGNYWGPEFAGTTEGNQRPTANFSFINNNQGLPATVLFDGSISTDPEGDSLSFRWDFGNGDTAHTRTPTATYQSAGQYMVSLTVRDDSLSSIHTQVIEIQDTVSYNGVLAFFDITDDWGNGYCAKISLENHSNLDLSGWEFDFEIEDEIYDIWSGIWQNQCESYRVSPVHWNEDFYQNTTVEFGYCAHYQDTIFSPRSVGINYSIPISVAAAWGYDPFYGDSCLPVCVQNFTNTENFEVPSNFWELGPETDRSLIYRGLAIEGNYSPVLKGNSGQGFIKSSKIGLDSLDALDLSFEFMATACSQGDTLRISASDGQGTQWVKNFVCGAQFQNRDLVSVHESLDVASFGDSIEIRVTVFSSSIIGRFAVDHVVLDGCRFQSTNSLPWLNVTLTDVAIQQITQSKIYPNPTNGIIYLKHVDGPVGVFTLEGKPVLLVEDLGKIDRLNLESLPTGTYVLRYQGRAKLIKKL